MRGIYTILILFALVSPLHALEVEEHLWGFDGKAVPQRFNILSVLVSNPSPYPYEGTLALYRTTGPRTRVGARLVRPCFLSPRSSRWVQFHPYFRGTRDRWAVEWGRGMNERADVPTPRNGPPATVLLTDPDDTLGSGRRLKSFPENLFPASVSATDGLYGLAIDHAPRWEAARRTAFLDWLRRGGVVHLLRGTNGKYPAFTGNMEILNVKSDSVRVGSGLVVRHDATARGLSERSLRAAGHALPELRSGNNAAIANLDDVFLYRLAELVRSDHNWTVIYILTVAYMLLVFPGNYLLGRGVKRYWIPIASFVALVACFGFVFSAVGRRGYGERTSAHSLSYARPLGGRSHDVTQWTNVFVTSGDYYTITHDSLHNLYSTCQEMEAVNAVVANGKNGAFRVDIPLYSKRSFMHRGVMEGHDTTLEVVSWRGDKRLEELILKTGPSFPEKPLAVWAVHAGTAYRMQQKDERIVLSTGKSQRLDDFLSSRALRAEQYRYHRYSRGDRDLTPQAVFMETVRPLIARALGGTDSFVRYVHLPASPADRVQLFLFARTPDGFNLRGDEFENETGYTLYHIDVHKPEART